MLALYHTALLQPFVLPAHLATLPRLLAQPAHKLGLAEFQVHGVPLAVQQGRLHTVQPLLWGRKVEQSAGNQQGKNRMGNASVSSVERPPCPKHTLSQSQAHPAPRQNRPATRARHRPSPVRAAGWMAGTAGARPAGSAGMARVPHPCCRAPRPAHRTCMCAACCGRASGGQRAVTVRGCADTWGPCIVNSRAGQHCMGDTKCKALGAPQEMRTRQMGCPTPLERIWGGSVAHTRRGCTCMKQCSFPSGPG